jgi:glycosyltransferase involved in cell wall biosynthesis
LFGNVESIHVQRWAGWFAAHGHDVHVADLWRARTEDGSYPYPVHRLGRAMTAFLRLRRLAHELDTQLVHVHYLTHRGWLAFASGIRPYAVTLWGSDLLLDLDVSPLRVAWARLVLRSAALVTADSPELLRRATALGAHADRSTEIQFGVDTDRFAPGPPDPALLAELDLVGKRVIFAPRTLAERYRAGVVVEALAALPDDVVLLCTLAGADGAYVEHLRALARDLRVADRLRLAPPIPHGRMADVYRTADVVASVPMSDATPVSILEALASGVPVVASDLPSVRPWLQSLDPAWLVPVDDVAATTAALRAVLDRPAQDRAALAERTRAIVIEHADHGRNMARVEQLYRALVG